jgi:cobalt-zinc-cadmium efflux system protein
MAHEHHEVSGKNLGITVLLNVIITLGELIGGIISGSMALITDAAHNFSDVLSLIISYTANRLAKRKPTTAQTFGYRRSEILAAFANSVTLITIAIFIIYEATTRILEPRVIQSEWVIYLAGASIVLNGLSVLLIRKDAKGNMNMRSALLHLFSDMLTSIAVLIGGIIIKLFGWYYIDAIFSIAIAGYLLYMSWAIFRDSLRILMQFTPKHIDVDKISVEINALPGITNLHHVHCWQLNDHDYMFEAHIDITEDISLSAFALKLIEVRKILANYDITHSNIQPEFNVADNKDLIHPKRE